MVNPVKHERVQQFASIDETIHAQDVMVDAGIANADRFEDSTSITRPNHFLSEAFWLAHFLLDQQKRANLHVAHANDQIREAINADSSDIKKVLNLAEAFKPDLQNFERLKAWKNKSSSLDLSNDQEFLTCLLKLLSDREDVSLIDWLNVGADSYDAYRLKITRTQQELAETKQDLEYARAQIPIIASKIEQAKTVRGKSCAQLEMQTGHFEITKHERLVELISIKLAIMNKKAKIFEFFISIGHTEKSPLDLIQNVIRIHIAPAINTVKQWMLFGSRCVELAGELTNMINEHTNTVNKKTRLELQNLIENKMEQIDREVSDNRDLIDVSVPS